MKQLNNKFISNNEYLIKLKATLYKKYTNNISNKFNLIIINSILSNRKIHIVSKFKDFLLYDEISEFLKRFYRGDESSTRLKKISKYFKETSVLYPNYSPLFESKYIYSNIIKKQMVIIKQENYKKKNKNCNIKKHYQDKNENIKNEIIFFTSTIYNDILNESESFMSLLFGIDNKKKTKDNTNIIKKNEGDKDIEELFKIIDMIENNEDHNIKKKDPVKNNNKKETEIITDISRKNKKKINTDTNNNNKIKEINFSSSLMMNKYKKKYKNFIKIEKLDKINYKNNNSNNNNNDTSKENNNNINSQQDNNQKSPNNNKMVYHRKVKSTLIGDYLNKLELPSNSNVVNMLKIANETYADNLNRNSMRTILYKTMKNANNGIELKKPSNPIISIPNLIHRNMINAKNNKNSNKLEGAIYKTQIISSPKMINNNFTSRNTKIQNIEKKIEIPKYIKKNNYFGIKKKNPPLSTRNYNSIISIYENARKNSINNNINSSNGNLFLSLNNNTISCNSVFSSYKKPENGFKSIYVNSNFTGPYSKPKCYDNNRYKGVSVKKLFSKSNEYIENEKEKMN